MNFFFTFLSLTISLKTCCLEGDEDLYDREMGKIEKKSVHSNGVPRKVGKIKVPDKSLSWKVRSYSSLEVHEIKA